MKEKQKIRAIHILLCVFIYFFLTAPTFSTDAPSAVSMRANNAQKLASQDNHHPFYGVDIAVDLTILGQDRNSRQSDGIVKINMDSAFTIIITVKNYGLQEAPNTEYKLSLPIEATVIDLLPQPLYTSSETLLWSMTVPPESDTTLVVSLSCRFADEQKHTFTVHAQTAGDINPDNDRDSLIIEFLFSQHEPLPADEILSKVNSEAASGSDNTESHVASANSSFMLTPPNVVSPESDGIPIEFVIAGGHVEMNLYDVAGRFITTLIDAPYEAGKHTFFWNGMTENGMLVGSGVYLVTLQTETDHTFKKMIIVR